MPDAIQAILRTYRELREGRELFIQTVRRLGPEPFKAAANAARHPAPEEELAAA